MNVNKNNVSIGCWNVNGFTQKTVKAKASFGLRKDIISHLGFDILALSETHLKEDEQLNLPGYRWVGNNRHTLHSRAKKGSGGVGFLIKDDLLEHYDYEVLDKTYEDLLWIKLVNKKDKAGIYLCSCYLPPASSSRGNSSQQFFSQLSSDINQLGEGFPIFVMGDLNARVGDMQDYEGAKRTPLDTKKNSHGMKFIKFLKSSQMCMLNGRGESKYDNFTSVSSRGKSVVDYIITPYKNLNCCSEFKVKLVSSCLSDFELNPGLASIPDHSILSFTCKFPEKQQDTPLEKRKTLKRVKSKESK